MDSIIQEKLDKDEKVLAESEKSKKQLIICLIIEGVFLFLLAGNIFFILFFIPVLINLIIIICRYCITTVVVTDKRVFVRAGITTSMEELAIADIDKMLQGVGYSYHYGATNTLTIMIKERKIKIKGISNGEVLCDAFEEVKKALKENTAKVTEALSVGEIPEGRVEGIDTTPATQETAQKNEE